MAKKKKATAKPKAKTIRKKTGRCDFAELQVGDRLSETQYYEITKKDDERIWVKNERGYKFNISKDIVEEGMFAANQYDEEQKVTRTELAEMLMSAGDTIFTVCFQKQLNAKNVFANFYEEYKDSSSKSKAALQKLMNGAMVGQERVLTGYLVRAEPVMGRSQVIDLELDPSKHRLRLVDHRNIQWLIYKNVRYFAK